MKRVIFLLLSLCLPVEVCAQQVLPPSQTPYTNFTQGFQLNGSFGAIGLCAISTGNGVSWGSCPGGLAGVSPDGSNGIIVQGNVAVGPNGLPLQPRYPNLKSGMTPRAGLVQILPWNQPITTGAANFGPTTGQTSRNFIDFGHLYRSRQTGSVTQVKVNIPSITGITGFYVSNCRTGSVSDATAANVDTISTSQNLAAQLVTGVNTLTLSSPLSVQWGDYPCGRVEWSGGASVQNFRTTAAISSTGETATLWYVDNVIPSATAYDWTAQTASTGNALLVEFDSTPPVLACTGDSIDSGALTTYAFTDVQSPLTAANNAYCDLIGQRLGITTQNFGFAGQPLSTVNSNFPLGAGLVAPRYVLAEGGVNNILFQSPTLATLQAQANALIANIQGAGAIPIMMGITPFRGDVPTATDAMLTLRDQYNAWLQITVVAAGGIYVNTDPYIGAYWSTGPAGNLWFLNAPYSGDAIHPSYPLGESRIAQAVIDALASTNSLMSTPATLPALTGPYDVTATGTVNTYAASIPALQPANVIPAGTILYLGIAITNTGTTTLSVNGAAAHQIVIRSTSFPLLGGELLSGQIYQLRYTTAGAGYWQILSVMNTTPTLANGINNTSPDNCIRGQYQANGTTNFYGCGATSFKWSNGTTPFLQLMQLDATGALTATNWIWAKNGLYVGSSATQVAPPGLLGYSGSATGKLLGTTGISGTAIACGDGSGGVTNVGCATGGGVTQIVAGIGTSISPAGGTGVVTINTTPAGLPNTLGCLQGYDSLPCEIATLASVTDNTVTATTGQTTLLTTARAGNYRLCGPIAISAAGTGTGTITWHGTWTGDAHGYDAAFGINVTANVVNSVNNFAYNGDCLDFYADTGTAIKYYLGVTGSITGAPTLRYGLKLLWMGS